MAPHCHCCHDSFDPPDHPDGPAEVYESGVGICARCNLDMCSCYDWRMGFWESHGFLKTCPICGRDA